MLLLVIIILLQRLSLGAIKILIMKTLKWVYFSFFLITSIICFTIVFLMYLNLSFIDYPYVYLGSFSIMCSLSILRLKVT